MTPEGSLRQAAKKLRRNGAGCGNAKAMGATTAARWGNNSSNTISGGSNNGDRGGGNNSRRSSFGSRHGEENDLLSTKISGGRKEGYARKENLRL